MQVINTGQQLSGLCLSSFLKTDAIYTALQSVGSVQSLMTPDIGLSISRLVDQLQRSG